MEEISKALEENFDPFVDAFVPSILRLCTRANKVFVTCANNCLKIIITHSKTPSIIPFLHEALHNPSKSLRTSASESLLTCFEIISPENLESHIETIESAIRDGVVDVAPTVRDYCRKSFEMYRQYFPERIKMYFQISLICNIYIPFPFLTFHDMHS